MTIENSVRELGRSLAQVHLKLSRVQEQLGASVGHTETSGAELEILLDLVDSVETALERRPQAGGWLWNRRARGEDLWRGLAVAAAAAREKLERAGIEPTEIEGPFDPELHHAVEVVASREAERHGTLAATHRRGWLRRKGVGRAVLRTAQVSVFGELS